MQEYFADIGRFSSEESIIDGKENKYKEDVESIHTLDPDEFFGGNVETG